MDESTMDGPTDVPDVDPAAGDGAGVGPPWHRAPGAKGNAGTQSVKEDVERKVRSAAGGGLDEAADAVRRLGRRAHERGGVAGRADPVAQRLGAGLETAAGYLRSHEVVDMRVDLEREVRQSPLRSLLIAGVAGFVVGRLIR